MVGVPQRWFVVESQARKQADRQKLEQRLEQTTPQKQRELNQLCAQEFACAADAEAALQQFQRRLEWHQLTAMSVVAQLRPTGEAQAGHSTRTDD